MATLVYLDGTPCDITTALTAIRRSDEVALAALQSGMTVTEVSQLSGLARTTIMRIRARAASGGPRLTRPHPAPPGAAGEGS